MSEHDEHQVPTPASEPLEPAPPTEPAPAAAVAAPLSAPPVEPRTRWSDRVFRMRSVAAVAVAGVILGAAGGAVTTALVSDDDGDRHERPGIGQQWGPGQMPAVPPGGRQVFPGMPGVPQGDDSDDDSSSSSPS